MRESRKKFGGGGVPMGVCRGLIGSWASPRAYFGKFTILIYKFEFSGGGGGLAPPLDPRIAGNYKEVNNVLKEMVIFFLLKSAKFIADLHLLA